MFIFHFPVPIIMDYELFFSQYINVKYNEWKNYIERAMKFVKNYDSIRVQMSSQKETTDDADEWKVSPIVIDDIEVS